MYGKYQRNVVLAFVCLAALLLVGCNQQAEESPTAVAKNYPAAPTFRLNTPAGQPVNLPQNGDAIDVFFFWATWCPYCKQLMPHLQSIKDEYGDQVNIYAINIKENGDPVKYIENNAYEFELLLEGDEVAELYGVEGTPGLILVDSLGQQRFDMSSLLAPVYKKLEGLKHGQRSRRIAPWWAGQIRHQLDLIIAD